MRVWIAVGGMTRKERISPAKNAARREEKKRAARHGLHERHIVGDAVSVVMVHTAAVSFMSYR
jgi:hypothetical protein